MAPNIAPTPFAYVVCIDFVLYLVGFSRERLSHEIGGGLDEVDMEFPEHLLCHFLAEALFEIVVVHAVVVRGLWELVVIGEYAIGAGWGRIGFRNRKATSRQRVVSGDSYEFMVQCRLFLFSPDP